MWRLQASLSFKNRACQLEDCSPCVSHKGTKDSATVTDWMLHTALMSLSERVHVCVHVSFCTSGSFVLSFHPERERHTSSGLSAKNKNPICSLFIVVLFPFSKRQ